MFETYIVLNWRESEPMEGGGRPKSRSNSRSFVYLGDKESGVRRETESGVVADGDDDLKE